MLRLAYRVVIVVLTVGCAVSAGMHAGVAAIARTDPAQALRLDGNDAEALVLNVDEQLTQPRKVPSPAVLRETARRALIAAPLTSGGLRLAGLAAQADSDAVAARNLMKLSLRVSRRDPITTIWMIEDRVAEGDVSGALTYYDLALTTNERAPELLFPVLTAALGDARVRSAFRPWIARKRPWMPAFLAFAVANTDRPQDLVDIFRPTGGMPDGTGVATLGMQLLSRLVATSQFEAASNYALSLRGAPARVLMEPGFTTASINPAFVPLAWKLADQPEVRARNSVAGKIAITATAGSRALAASRISFIRPGTYRLTQIVSSVGQFAPASLTWRINCLSASEIKPAWQQDIAAKVGELRYEYRIVIPADCIVQQWSLTVTAADSQDDSEVLVGPLALKPGA